MTKFLVMRTLVARMSPRWGQWDIRHFDQIPIGTHFQWAQFLEAAASGTQLRLQFKPDPNKVIYVKVSTNSFHTLHQHSKLKPGRAEHISHRHEAEYDRYVMLGVARESLALASHDE